LGGCAGALLVGGLAGVAGGGYAAAQERGIGGAVSDLQIETNVESAFAAIDPGLKDGITTTVYQGRVLLTGTVPTPQMKMRAVEVASRVSGIKALYDDVELAPSRATWDATNDAWIGTDPLRPHARSRHPVRQLHNRHAERVGVPDRFGALAGGA
jgi:osmotically-inducible protein OsmY